MATVYRAYQPQTERQVAIKVLRKAALKDDTSLERFRREARLIARLENPHILPVFDFDGAHDPPYIVMRYIEGGTLEDLLAKRLPTPPEVRRLTQQVAAALNYAHRQGIVHRDIKPSNIMLDSEGNAFVTDFGIARMSGARLPGTSITQDGTVIGTPDYIAPKQALGNMEVDGRADVYSLGIIVFEMLSGRLPFVADTPMAVMIKHLQEAPPSLHALNPRLPLGIDSVLAQALAKDPADRYSTAGEFISALSALLGEATDQGLDARNRPGSPSEAASEAAGAHRSRTPVAKNKVVTALYVDATETVKAMTEGSDAATARASINTVWEPLAQIVATYTGAIVSRSDIHLLALWGADSAGEDDPERALRAALALKAATPDPTIRIAVHTGLALLSSNANGLTASGATIGLAQQLAEFAEGGVLVSHDTYREVRGMFDFAAGEAVRLRGRKDKLNTYIATGIKGRFIPLGARGVEGIETRLAARWN
jgi:serine/threonine protein kinase